MPQSDSSDEDGISSASIVVAFISLLVGTGLMLQSQAEIAETGAVKAFNAGGDARQRGATAQAGGPRANRCVPRRSAPLPPGAIRLLCTPARRRAGVGGHLLAQLRQLQVGPGHERQHAGGL
jgi:hypothetical protein